MTATKPAWGYGGQVPYCTKCGVNPINSFPENVLRILMF